MVDSDSDSDVALNEEIPRNSNHEIILNSESQWNSNNNHVRLQNRSRHYRRGVLSKHRQHHGRTKTGTGGSYHHTDDYFELARQARLLSKGDEIPDNTVNDPEKHAVLQRNNEVRDKGKAVDHTGESRLNSSRFQWNKPFRNQKNKQGLEGCSSTFNGNNRQRKLVRNGCISPDNVSQFGRMSGHNAGPSGHSHKQVVGVDDRGKGKLGLSDYSGAQNSDHGVMLHKPREASTCNEKRLGSSQRRKNHFTGKRKQRMDQPNLGEASSSILGSTSNHTENFTIVNSFGKEEIERDSCNEEYWSVEEAQLNNEEVPNGSAKISQVESDEIMARRLQEQFNQEAQHFPTFDEEDDDATIARALQEEDDDYNVDDHDIMPLRRNIREVSDRGGSRSHMYTRGHHIAFERSSLQIPRRAQTRFNGPEMDYEMMLISQLRRGLGTSNMDIDTRLSIWEALEEVFGNETDNMDISDDIYRGFYDDEYEIFSAVDEDNHQHTGAADGQINILPISTIKEDRVEDACVICLEVPVAGDAMRHLPCLHKFHKECIDKWLRRKNACPVCKSAIT